MYSLKVKKTEGWEKASAVKDGISEECDTCGSERTNVVEQLDFSAGNPRVEHVTGVVHLYRELEDVPKESGREADDMGPGEVGLPKGRNCQICVMSTPPDMGFAEFCTFLGLYFEKVKQIRLVRRDGGKACHLVLLSFCDQESADGFYREYNSKPVRFALSCFVVLWKSCCLSDAVLWLRQSSSRYGCGAVLFARARAAVSLAFCEADRVLR